MEAIDNRLKNVRTGVRRVDPRPGERRSAGKIEEDSPLSSMSHPSPLKLVIIVAVSIFLAESAIMALFTLLPPISIELAIFIDSSLLIVLVLLPLYYFFVKPMTLSLAERKLLEDKLRSLSLTDELTGLYNRRALFSYGEYAAKAANRGGKELCLLYADLDNLKVINDELGHKEGDKAIVNIARLLKNNFRESDIVARLGGDEFAIVPVEANSESLDLINERLNRRLEEHNSTVLDSYKLALSIGKACSDSANTFSIDELLDIADRSMYEHKISKNSLH
jgi:diguanylate cyclase (GGDEF)-like protein